MMTARFSLSHRLVVPGLALFIALAHGTPASAQGLTADPYRPYNSQYDPYVYPVYPSGGAVIPNQQRLTGRSGPAQANQFQDFLEGNRFGFDSSGPSRSAGAGVPYYQAHRRFNPNNRPNNSEADRLFREKQEDRDTRYFEARKKYQEAVSERDPEKRARLIKEYAAAKRLAEQDSQRTPDPSEPGQKPEVGPRGTTDPPAARRAGEAGPRPFSSAAPTTRRGTSPGLGRPRTSPLPARPGRVGVPPVTRTPSQILRESESLDRSDQMPTPPPSPRLQPSPDPR
jgi:hypothetical protein